MKIIHFSDPHFGSWPSTGSAFFDKRIVGTLNYQFARKSHFNYRVLELAIQRIITLEPQYVILSGDITSVGDPKEFDQALAYLNPLILHPTIKLIYVPGNHDIYVNNAKNRSYFSDFFKRINGFEFSELPKTISELNVKFILMNQALPTVPFMSNGVLGPVNESALLEPKQENEIRIGVGHFPVTRADGKPLNYRRRLIGAEQVKKQLDDSLDLYLCGHIHKPFINQHGFGQEICAGSITSSAHLNVLEINQVETTIEQHWEIIHDDKNEIKKIMQPNFSYSTS